MLKTLTLVLYIILSPIIHATSSCVYSDPKSKFIYGKTMDTIGDSITWMAQGKYMRCLLRDKGLFFDFVGLHQDGFGFMHDGEGGDTSVDVLNRIEKIFYADAYFLLLGTNDTGLTPQQTVQNLLQIGKALNTRNNSAPIFISTLLPTTGVYSYRNERNQLVNQLLLLNSKQKKLCENCYVLDVGGLFYATPGWERLYWDGIHPTEEGYELLTSLIVKALSQPLSS